MKYEELIILAPCHSLEDFPLYHTGDDAAGLLAAWTALWHPALLIAAQSLPKLERADVPPDDLENRLVVVPTVSEGELDPELPNRVATGQTVLIRGQTQRAPIVQQALSSLDGGDAGVGPELAADFFSLGFAYLQVELLTRQMRYSSSLDESRFRSELLAAANAATGHDDQQAQQHLVSCHDALADERNHYYPVDVYLIDLTVVASKTIGEALRRELAEKHPTNLLISAQTVEKVSRDEPLTQEALRRGIERGHVCLVGGELAELPLPLLSPETALRQLQTGTASYVANLGRSPLVFGRRRFGLTPQLPQLLQQLGFRGALHATLDDGRFPESSQYKTQWEGIGGGSLDALARAPLDAAKPDTFLNFPSQLSESMDMDHVATRCFAHWPGQASTSYEDLRRAARFGAALGKFVTLEDYFAETGDTGQHDRFQADVYRSPYLTQSVTAHLHDPLSRCVRYWRRRVAADSLRALAALTLGIAESPGDVRGAGKQIDALCDVIDRDADFTMTEAPTAVEDELSSLSKTLTDQLQSDTSAAGVGLTVINPFSFVRRMVVDSTSLAQDAEVTQPVYASGPSRSGRRLTVVDVPAMGMARIAAVAARSDRAAPDIAAEYELRNEFLQAYIDPETGALRSIADYSSRGTRLSQQLALRIAPPKTGQPWIDNKRTVSYSVMSADSIDITENGSILGEIVTRGRLLDVEGTSLADFVQRCQLARGSRVLALEFELDPHVELGPDPWDSYLACRFAWSDEAALLARGTWLQRQSTAARRIESPLFVEIDSGGKHTAILTGGLPFHQRVAMRKLDSLLIVRGETARKFRIGVALDVRYPVRAALEFLAPDPLVTPLSGPPGENQSSWLFHVDAKNVVATYWRPLLQDGKSCGVRVRLLETEGRSASVRFRAYWPARQARLIRLDGSPQADCTIEGGVVHLQLLGNQWRELEVVW